MLTSILLVIGINDIFMKIPIYQIDAFADHKFSGNPAAVVFPSAKLQPDVMQYIAAENNLAETAFVTSEGEYFEIRWFTPTIEVGLCGHATLAAAHALFNHLDYGRNSITFSSKSGLLHVRKEAEILYLDFPADTIQKVENRQDVTNGLGSLPKELYRGRDDFLAIFDDEDSIISLSPNMDALYKVPSRGIIASAPGRDVDFVSRFFAPQSGIPEDSVTGSAHTTLTPYWSKRLSKQNLTAKQLSKRGGILICNDLDKRVEIGGHAVTYLIGEISI
jgi:PhzF family phenazine biosynthesis protein